jgi:hypothetical protein
MNDGRARKLAANEALARDVNERVEEVAASWYAEREALEFICECSADDCKERVHLRASEYRRVRESPQTFVVVRDHVVPEIERVVGELGDGVIVEKTGPGREVADETAP